MTIAETASESPWAAFAPTVLEIPQDRWEEFLKTAPTDTVISLGSSFEELYQKRSYLAWMDLQSIDQAYDEDDTASFAEFYPSQLLAHAQSAVRHSWTPFAIKVLRLGGKS